MVRKLSYFFFLVFLVTGCGKGDDAGKSAGGEHSHGTHQCAPCQQGQAGGTIWCDSCKMGFIDGKTTTDKAAVDAALKAADAEKACDGCSEPKAECSCHGHDHEEGTCSCAAGKAGGTTWCEHCGSGYINGVKSTDKAAVEAALKAAAEPAPAENCAGCSKPKAECSCHGHGHGHDHDHDHAHEEGACSCAAGKAGGTTWCAHCGSGYINGVKSTDQAAVEAALKAATPAPAPAGE